MMVDRLILRRLRHLQKRHLVGVLHQGNHIPIALTDEADLGLSGEKKLRADLLEERSDLCPILRILGGATVGFKLEQVHHDDRSVGQSGKGRHLLRRGAHRIDVDVVRLGTLSAAERRRQSQSARRSGRLHKTPSGFRFFSLAHGSISLLG